MQVKHLVVVGTSAGGIEALRELVHGLPEHFPAAIALVLHTSPQSPGVLPEILSRAGPVPATHPRDRQRLEPGRIYVAPPDHHLLIEPGIVRVTKGPKENRFRPAIDPLFRSAAQIFGPATIGVILTGNLDDGAAGLWAIKQLGGTAIVQSPEEALFPSMPLAALHAVSVDHVVPLREIGPLLVSLTTIVAERPPAAVPTHVDIEVRIAKEEDPVKAGVHDLGEPSRLACPECHGVLLAVKEGTRTRFRCHTGHAYSPESLLAEINESIETSLWTAMRSMQEGSLLMRHVVAHAETAHPATDTGKLADRARELDRQAGELRTMVTGATAVAQQER